jgi:hypothetical protein
MAVVMQNYQLQHSTTDGKGNKASIGVGMMKRQDQHQHITNFIDVNSVDEYSS